MVWRAAGHGEPSNNCLVFLAKHHLMWGHNILLSETVMGPGLTKLLNEVSSNAAAAGVFGQIAVSRDRLTCEAKASAEPAEYRLGIEDAKLCVSLVTANRWLSESIETDLLHTGDKLEELLEDELFEVEYPGPPLAYQHYRSDDKLFTFRSALPIAVTTAGDVEMSPDAAALATKALLAYEACFRQLGDMEVGPEDE
jgi:hypothetical protein